MALNAASSRNRTLAVSKSPPIIGIRTSPTGCGRAGTRDPQARRCGCAARPEETEASGHRAGRLSAGKDGRPRRRPGAAFGISGPLSHQHAPVADRRSNGPRRRAQDGGAALAHPSPMRRDETISAANPLCGNAFFTLCLVRGWRRRFGSGRAEPHQRHRDAGPRAPATIRSRTTPSPISTRPRATAASRPGLPRPTLSPRLTSPASPHSTAVFQLERGDREAFSPFVAPAVAGMTNVVARAGLGGVERRLIGLDRGGETHLQRVGGQLVADRGFGDRGIAATKAGRFSRLKSWPTLTVSPASAARRAVSTQSARAPATSPLRNAAA